MANLQAAKLFMVDMDGTFYLEDALLPGAAEFLNAVRETGKRMVFVTNNSSKSKQAYITRLKGMGICASPEDIYTSSEATMAYLRQNYGGQRILLLGTQSLCREFEEEGFLLDSQHPQLVVIAFDTELDYAKLSRACSAVRSGLPYIATHPDKNCPVQGGYIPDIGAVIAFIEASAGRLPDLIVGKPHATLVKQLAQKYALPFEQIVMVGDRLYTDIAMGRWGIVTALMLTGETTRADLQAAAIQPDFVFENIGELAKKIKPPGL